MKTTLNPNWVNLELQHRHGGDGFAIVQDLGDDMCRVALLDKTGVGNRAFLVWQKLLKPMLRKPSKDEEPVEQPLNTDQVAALNALRDDLESGKRVVRFQHIVKP